MVPPYQLLGVPVVPPYHLIKILKLCKTSFYELKVIVLMKEKLFPVSLKPNLILKKLVKNWWGPVVPPYQLLGVPVVPPYHLFESFKNWSKTGGVLWSPLPTGSGVCGPPLPLDQNFETL